MNYHLLFFAYMLEVLAVTGYICFHVKWYDGLSRKQQWIFLLVPGAPLMWLICYFAAKVKHDINNPPY